MSTTSKTILIVEDDDFTRALVRDTLTAAAHTVIEAESAASGFSLFQTKTPDLAILDVKLPDGSGIELCRKIREHKKLSDTPVIILTGESELDRKRTGFAAGADQYLVKPIHAEELLLWVAALLRRHTTEREGPSSLTVGELTVDAEAYVASFKGRVIAGLTTKEFELLWFLLKNRPKVMSRRGVLTKLWRTVAVDHLVDAHLYNLRKKLPPAVAACIQAVPGKGFRFFGVPGTPPRP